MENKPILYIEIDFVLVDFYSGFAQIGFENLQKYKKDHFAIPGLYAKSSPTPGAIEAYHKLSDNYDIYFVHNCEDSTPDKISDIVHWINAHFGEEATQHLIFIPHFHLLKGDYLIYHTIRRGPQFEGKAIFFEHLHPEIEWNMICQHLLSKEEPAPNRHITFPVIAKGSVTLLKESWDTDSEHLLMYEFNEEELQILTRYFAGLTPEDNVGSLIDEHLLQLNDFIFERLLNFANSQTTFNGEPEDILQFLYDNYAYFPMDFVKRDIERGLFIPSLPAPQYTYEEELIAEWCDWRRKSLHKITFLKLVQILEEEYDAPVKFFTNTDYDIFFPQELHDFIKAENEKMA